MRTACLSIAAVFLACALNARVFLTQQQALAGAFPPGTAVARQTFFLSKGQMEAIRNAAGSAPRSALVVRYAGTRDSRPVGYVYFDSHRVRTEPETVMVMLNPEGAITRVEILSFDEPQDYFPKRRWLDQFSGRKLDRDLALDRSIRPMTGASLTGKSILEASRRILAIHALMAEKVAKP